MILLWAWLLPLSVLLFPGLLPKTGLFSPIKWHGGKFYMASDIVLLMPPHIHYVEAYAGGLNVLFAKNPEGISEVVNDIDGDLTNFWRVLSDEDEFVRFQRAAEATPFSEFEWNSKKPIKMSDRPCHKLALWFFIRCRQSLAGRMEHFAPLSKKRTRRGMNEQVSAWLTSVDGLYMVHNRLKRVVILNQDAPSVINKEDGEQTLFYLDPTYLKETRTAPNVYRHEMTEEQHIELLSQLRGIDGKFMLSGYRSDLYDTTARLAGWNRHDFELPNNAAGGKEKRRMIECIWCNF